MGLSCGGNVAVIKEFNLSLLPSDVEPSRCNDVPLCALCTELLGRFGDIEAQKRNFELLYNLFAIDVETAPVQIQMELIELQCNGTLRTKYDTTGPAQFIRSIREATSQLMWLEPSASMVAHFCVRSCSQ